MTQRRNDREYDAFGNFVAQTVRGCFGTFHCYTSSVRGREVIGTTNRFQDPNSETAPYDAAGNVLRDNNREFTYDAVSMTTSAYANGQTFEYLYNADDERLPAVDILTTGGYETRTLRGFANQLLTVLEGENWKEDQIWRGSVVAGYNTPDGKRHYGVDYLGSPRVVTNAFGSLIGTQEFTPFGSGGSTGSGALQLTGHERDQANLGDRTADLPNYAHARFLDTGGGRFLSVDPVLDVETALRRPQTWNRYSYVANNPVNSVDPSGAILISLSGQNTLRDIAGQAAANISFRQDGSLDTSKLTQQDLAGNEGALLLQQMAVSTNVYTYEEGKTAQTQAGTQQVSDIANLDDNSTDLILSSGSPLTKGPARFPVPGVNGAITINPSVQT